MSNLNKTTYLPEEMAEEIRGIKDAIIDTNEHTVNFYDYDGSLLYSYAPEVFLSLTDMPPNPSHDGLVAQGWNWDLPAAKTYVSAYGKLNIGQMYTTSDGKTRLYIHIDDEWMHFYFRIKYSEPDETENTNPKLIVDWGDGEVDQYTPSHSILYSYTHTYASSGDYVVSIEFNEVTGDLKFSKGFYDNSSAFNDYDCLAESPSFIRKIEIGDNIVSFGSHQYTLVTFWSFLYNLESITLPASLNYISGGAFESCYRLKHVTIPKGISLIANAAFQNDFNLKSISLPAEIEGIGEAAFYRCSNLRLIAPLEYVTRVGSHAFHECQSLDVPIRLNSLTNIADTEHIYSDYLNFGSLDYRDGSYSRLRHIAHDCFHDCSCISEVIIPEGIQYIDDNAFKGCSALKYVRIPNGTVGINAHAFDGCVQLEHFNLPLGITRIYSGAFANCKSLDSIVLPDGVTIVESELFMNCINLRKVTLSAQTKEIQDRAFAGCRKLKQISFPDTLRVLGEAVFDGCERLSTIYFKTIVLPEMAVEDQETNPFCIGTPPVGTIYVPTGCTNYYLPIMAATSFRNFTIVEYDTRILFASAIDPISGSICFVGTSVDFDGDYIVLNDEAVHVDEDDYIVLPDSYVYAGS